MNRDWWLHARAEAYHRAADGARAVRATGLEGRLRARESARRWESGRRGAARDQAVQARGTPLEQQYRAAIRKPRAAGNRQHVRDLLADREPQYARTLDRTVRDLSPRKGRVR